MALVMLPCDLPWWSSIQKHLTKLSNTKNTLELIEGMQKIHELCNISLDPDDDDSADNQLFVGLLNFLDNDLTTEERSNFLNKTLPNMVNRALELKKAKPRGGLHFSLQQQPDITELDYTFVASLIANAFFSTFPRRTAKSHPTLQNFNFSNFFLSLQSPTQQAKLKSLFAYFDWLDTNDNLLGSVRVLRQVMSSKEWLTIEDWLECTLPLCALQIKHEGRLERSDEDCLHVCFSSSKVGGKVLTDGMAQECLTLFTIPEILPVMLSVEALEDNEVLTIENPRHAARIVNPKHRAFLENISSPQKVTVTCVDAEDYTRLPVSQFEEDNILRELNKCLLAFQQKQPSSIETSSTPYQRHRRLSPIGESIGSNNEQNELGIPLITQQSCSTNQSSMDSAVDANKESYSRLRVRLEAEKSFERNAEGVLNNRRGRFIVLGSSGECLPVKRRENSCGSAYSSCTSSEDEYHSARTSLDEGSGDEDFNRRYSRDLESPERRFSFAERLKDALRRETPGVSSSSESSYAVGISVAGSGVGDQDIKVRRGGSTGFMLKEESLDEDFLRDSLQHERKWINKFKTKHSALSKRDSNKSTDYSFSTEYSSELEEVYDQFSKWLDDPILETDKGTNSRRTLSPRDLAVVQFAGSLLKRTLSETFAGVPLTEGCANDSRKSKIVLDARSLSLELARQKHRLAAQLIPSRTGIPKKGKKLVVSWVTQINQTLEDINVKIAPSDNPHQLSQIAQKASSKGGDLRTVSTGNWGCGSSRSGDVQLKVIIQWLAASVAGVPSLLYYTCGHKDLTKLDTLCRLLVDRKWTVKDLAEATLRYSERILLGKVVQGTLFEELIGIEKSTS